MLVLRRIMRSGGLDLESPPLRCCAMHCIAVKRRWPFDALAMARCERRVDRIEVVAIFGNEQTGDGAIGELS
ncbi:hypothetical protein [Burkholderia lata]|uniref:hypothetical protein n=1 Tax=Burkholderia lata (strain ATCC 17760 / DSM 23089 / LMG 22485 / NCIMB 9086 / R18194 / 383) TaxID=482957 RepID=UPI00158243A5|nr:hypothetical protein [Burkholderia lata]